MIHFFNFYPSEKRGVLIIMSTLFILLIFKRIIINNLLGPSEISIVEKIEVYHPSYYNNIPCIDLKDSLTEAHFNNSGIDSVLIYRILENRRQYGGFNCVLDLLDVKGINSGNLAYFKELSFPEFLDCPILNINDASAEEVAKFFRININKGKTLVKYRNSIGGFVKFEQINQVYRFPKIKLQTHWANRVEFGDQPICLLDLKKVTYIDLVKHGFISPKSASVLIGYKKERNLTLDDIRQQVSVENKPLVSYYFKE